MNVVVGYVPNDRGKAAFQAGLEMAGSFGLGLKVVNSSDRQSAVDPDLAPDADLQTMESEASGHNVELSFLRPAGTDGVEALLQAAELPDTKMIVIGIRNRSKVGKLIMGSSAQQILLEAQCPVLAVKA